MGSTSSVSMLPSPSRLKSLASELSPVLTTPPPVEPKTVLVLMSVPEMMLSSNLVVLRRRAAMMPAMPASTISAPPPMAHVGVLPKRSSMNDGSAGFFAGVVVFASGGVDVSGPLTAGATADVAGVDVSGHLTAGATAGVGGVESGALVSGAFASDVRVTDGGGAFSGFARNTKLILARLRSACLILDRGGDPSARGRSRAGRSACGRACRDSVAIRAPIGSLHFHHLRRFGRRDRSDLIALRNGDDLSAAQAIHIAAIERAFVAAEQRDQHLFEADIIGLVFACDLGQGVAALDGVRSAHRRRAGRRSGAGRCPGRLDGTGGRTSGTRRRRCRFRARRSYRLGGCLHFCCAWRIEQ